MMMKRLKDCKGCQERREAMRKKYTKGKKRVRAAIARRMKRGK